jgi:hypothetical protein
VSCGVGIWVSGTDMADSNCTEWYRVDCTVTVPVAAATFKAGFKISNG